MKMFMGVIAIGLLAVGALKYGIHLAGGASDVEETVRRMKESIQARQQLMNELAPTPDVPKQAEAAAEKPEGNAASSGFRFPRFMSPDGTEHQPYGGAVASRAAGSVTVSNVTRAKCRELAEKWVDRVTINGVSENPIAACTARNTLEYRP